MGGNLKIIQAGKIPVFGYLKKVWSYKSLILILAKRDIKSRYSQTLLGLLWAAGQPLIGLLVFTFFFQVLLKIDTGDCPYPLFAFSGMVSWYYFTFLVAQGGTCLSQESHIISKIYFPKMILVLSKAMGGLLELGISILILLVIMVVTGNLPGWEILCLPVFILMNMLAGLSIALWLSALTVRYRDFHHVIPYVVNLGIWLTPVFYPTTIIPSGFNSVLYLNPMAGVIAGFRWTVLGGPFPDWQYSAGIALMILLLVSGVYYFLKVENRFADTA